MNADNWSVAEAKAKFSEARTMSAEASTSGSGPLTSAAIDSPPRYPISGISSTTSQCQMLQVPMAYPFNCVSASGPRLPGHR